MDVLILSCGTGGGHNSAALAIKEAAEARGHHAEMFNPYDLRSGRLSEVIDKAYISVATHAPILFGFLYLLGNLYRHLPIHSPVYALNGRMSGKMEAYLKTHHTDVIVMTHFFPGHILAHMARRGMDIPKTILVATDYTCLPFEEECACDAYVIPAEDLTKDFAKYGIPEEKIHPLGIPVGRAFQRMTAKQEARKILGFEETKHYILAAGGSIGAGKLPKTIRILSELLEGRDDVQVIVICGSNAAVFHKLQKRFGDQIKIIGNTTQMPLYMSACDLYLTKAGGLSTTEAAVSGTPLALMPSIPGCESYNIRYFEKKNMCCKVRANRRSLKEMLTLLDAEDARRRMADNQRMYIHPDAAMKIVELADALVCESEEDEEMQQFG